MGRFTADRPNIDPAGRGVRRFIRASVHEETEHANVFSRILHPKRREEAVEPPPSPTPAPQDRRIAFVLGGGGGKGSCQVGMLRALLESGIRADLVVGVSVGALNGAKYAEDPSIASIDALGDLWTSLDQDGLFPKRLFGNSWRYAQKSSAVFPASGLVNLIKTHISVADIADMTIPLQVLAAKYEDGAEVWFDHGPPQEVLYASAAIPGVFPPFTFNGETLVDGGIVDDAPILRAVDLGATEIYMLLCGTSYSKLPPSQRPLEAILRSVIHTKLAKFRSDVRHLPSDITFTLLDCPEAAGIEALDFSKKDLLLKAGYERSMAILSGRLKVNPLDEGQLKH